MSVHALCSAILSGTFQKYDFEQAANFSQIFIYFHGELINDLKLMNLLPVPPRVTESQLTVSAVVGRSAELGCMMIGDPTPRVVWYKG